MGSLFRPPVVSEFQRNRVTSVQRRWQALKVGTWIAMGVAAYLSVAATEYPGDSRGDHALRPLQHGLKTAKEALVTGDWSRLSFSPPILPRARIGPAGGRAAGEASAAHPPPAAPGGEGAEATKAMK